MILRNCLILLSIWLSLSTVIEGIESERWSRQTANSEWIPLTRPRAQQSQSQIPVAPNQAQLPTLQSINLSPALRQEYQQQLLQLQKTQESINKILLLQQQVRAQQQLLQNQAYLPNVVGPDDERQQFRPNSVPNDERQQFRLNSVPNDERQQFRPNSVPNGQPFTANNQEGLVSSPQLSSEVLPSVYPAQQFKSHSDQEVQEIPSGSSSTEEKGENSDEEIQVVYVPAETLAQRGQPKEERNRDHKQFSIPRQQQRYQVDQIGTTGSGEDGSYNPEYVHFPRGQEAEQFFKDARQKELDRLNEERKQIQKQANIHAAARMREQERARQREAETKLKELAKIEELAKQRELDRIREAREHARIEELERARERAMKLKEEKAKQEIERLAAVERQKNAVKQLEKLAKQEEEVRVKELAAKKHIHDQSDEINHHQHHTETVKSKNSRLRNKTRPRLHHKTHEEYEQNQESSTLPPPNQPPLAVFMGSDLEAQEVRVVDVLRVLKDSKSIAVLDQVTADTPKVFVGPSNLGPPHGYAKFNLPYLSSLDTNRVERRVDKIPFFVAPLSFDPPQGYSKIPFPAPHIGSVIVNNLEDGGASFGISHKPAPNPLIEPNSFIPPTGQGSTPYQTYESSTASPYSPYTQEQVTPQYSSSVYPSTHEDRYKYRQQQYEQGGIPNLESQESPSISPYQEEVTAAPRPQEYSEQTYLSQVTSDGYQRPNIVSSFSYSQNPISTTPVYQDSYAHTRTQPNKDQELTSQLAQINQHDYSHHQHTENSFIHPNQQSGLSHHHHLYQINPNVQGSYEDPSQSGPTQYNLPAELPPIHPQLPGLVNSLLEGKDADKSTTIITTPEPTTTTATEATTTNYRTRVRQRGRIASRPTTSTTTSSPTSPGVTKSYERTRRPFNRSRSRYTTSTTEEYRDTSYEPTKAKIPETTQRYNNQEQYRRPVSTRAQKLKNRGGDRNTYETTALNQIPRQETLSDEGSLPEDSNNARQSTYSHYNVQLGTESPSAYLHEGSVETSPNSFSTERDYSKSPNYPSLSSSHRNEKVGVNAGISQQHYQDKYHAPASGYSENLEGQTGGFDYDTREGIRDSTPTILSSPADYNYYQDKSESAEPGVQTAAPVYTQILEYRPSTRPDIVGQIQETGVLIDDTQGLISTAITERELETTTELPPTTTTSAPVILRQRVRARLGGRPRQDSAIQTQPRGPQEEYVRFSAVNTPSRSSTTNRGRDSTRPRPKTRPNYYNQAQVQSEGNEYVRIQSANRSYPKTIVQAAAPRTTTTTIAPLTTTEDSSLQDDDEYGFIRPPSFNQPHHHISSKFRAPDSQIQLQNVAPTDETAEDSSPTHTQIPKHRQKYQSPHRPRPTIKSSTSPITTPPTSPEGSSFTTKPRVRAEEPKNRLKVRGRRPLRKRPTSTTTTSTTEYILEGNNNLPLEENYPKIPINPTEGNIERQLYESNYETLPPNSGSLGGPSRADYVDESYPTQEFMLNFGASSLIEEQQDQSHSIHHPGHNYHVTPGHRHGTSGSRLRPYSNHAVAPEPDIYGSESQWSTKLTKSSFQPINQLNHDEEQMRQEKEYQSQDKENEPEIITAKPEEIMTVLVTSDNQTNITRNGENAFEVTTESADFGMKMSAVEMKPESGDNVESNVEHVPQRRRLGGKRRRVRVRVRPAKTDDFVTAESQHFNSAINNLVQDRVKYTMPDTLSSEFIKKTTESVEKQPSTTTPPEISNGDESITPSGSTTINYTEIPEYTKQLDVSTLQPVNNEESVETKSPQEVTTTTENSQTQFDTTLSDNSTATSLTTPLTIPRKSWDSLTAYNEWLKKKMEKTLISSNNELKTGDKDANEDTKVSNNLSEENSHPKNHRSEWSEVRYPSDRNIYGYGRSEKITTTTTQVPGLVTKPSGDVKALSDYVQAIFESMKTADEERAIIDNAPNLWNDETKSTTQVYDFPSALSTIIGIRKTSSESAEEDKDFKAENKEDVSTLSTDNEKEGINKVTEVSSTPTESTSLKEEPTTLLQTSTEALTSDSGISTTIDASTTIEPTTSTAKNAAEMLGAILRTSTSTKVSHMTEICYRGRCVMTKPRKDFHER